MVLDPIVLKKPQIPQSVYEEMRKYHNNMTNVYKELLFAVTEEEKRKEQNPDFLLPLLLEGDFGTTFPKFAKQLIRPSLSWYSFQTGEWTSYTDYIEDFTSYEKGLGILPCLLGLNRRDDYPEFRRSCVKKYKNIRKQLILELKEIEVGDVPKPLKKSTPVARNRFILLSNPDAKGIDAKAVTPLLELVVKGKQNEAEAMIIEQKHALVQVSGSVTDPSGRKFTVITPFKYAVWSGDWGMSEMILKYLPPEIALFQFNELDEKGTEHGLRFKIDPLINALQTYVDKAEAWQYNKYAINHWTKGVGDNQRLLPISIVNRYCQPGIPFDPCPNFEEISTSRVDTVKIGTVGYWYTAKLSDGMWAGFYRGTLKDGAAGCKSVAVKNGEGPPSKDIIALRKLWEVRSNQFKSLKPELQEVASHRLV